MLQILSPNRNSPRNRPIDRITIHCLVGQWTAEQIGKYFATPAVKASCNYGVGKDGSVVCCVPETDRSWCSSSAANDNRAVTIETASDTKHPYAVTDAAYNALIDLVEDICRRNGKKRLTWIPDKDKALAYKPAADEMILTVHRWFANKACPGDYLYERQGAIAAEVTRRLNEEDEMAEPIYNKLEDMPGVYRPSVEKYRKRMEARGFSMGTDSGLDLTRSMVRMIVYMDRAGLLDL